MICGCQTCGQFPNQALGLPVRVSAINGTLRVMRKFKGRQAPGRKFAPSVKRLPRM